MFHIHKNFTTYNIVFVEISLSPKLKFYVDDAIYNLKKCEKKKTMVA